MKLNVWYVGLFIVVSVTKMSTASGIKCQKNLSECPKGHEMEICKMADGDSGRYCKQCGEITFQPNTNRFGDQCRMRQTCNKYKMDYKQYGNSVTDAECVCDLGYHFENEDQRACVPNKECGKGYGQGIFGTCENCLDHYSYSDTVDNFSRCKPLRNCAKEKRCTLVESNGTNDNKCGPEQVKDISDCDSLINTYTSKPPAGTNVGLIVGVVFGFIAVLVVIILFVFLLQRRQAKRKLRRTTKEELDEVLQEIIKRSRKDEIYCKKVLTIAQKEVEDRINNQIWALPQELFRNHIEPAKYEVLLEKYKEKQHKFAINGYLQDWRSWRGDTSEAVEEMVNCLKSDKVKREDIVYEIVTKLKEDYPEVVDGYTVHKRSADSTESFCAVLFPCACKDVERDAYETKETSNRLLDTQQSYNNDKDNNTPAVPPAGQPHDAPGDGDVMTPTDAGAHYRKAVVPSAPAIVDDNFCDSGEHPNVEVKGTHFYDRSDSLPVQASS